MNPILHFLPLADFGRRSNHCRPPFPRGANLPDEIENKRTDGLPAIAMSRGNVSVHAPNVCMTAPENMPRPSPRVDAAYYEDGEP